MKTKAASFNRSGTKTGSVLIPRISFRSESDYVQVIRAWNSTFLKDRLLEPKLRTPEGITPVSHEEEIKMGPSIEIIGEKS